MKKTLFFAVMAGAALAGCIKDEPVAAGSDSPERITFDAPVVTIPTRATEIYGNFPKDETFAVYALHTQAALTTPVTAEVTDPKYYMANVTCAADNETTPNYWAPARNYYWPKNGYLHFAAYTPVATSGVAWDAYHGFKFTNYTVAAEDAQKDLLFSNPEYNKTEDNMVTDQPYDGITLVFNHALSSIVFKARAEGMEGSDEIVITKIELKNIYDNGDFDQNLDVTGTTNPAAWDVKYNGTPKNYIVYDNATGLKLGNDEVYVNGAVDGKVNDADETYGPGDVPTDPNSTNDGKRRSDLILMPQHLDGATRGTDKADAMVEITYKITANGTATTETVPFKLAVKNGAAEGNPVYDWEMGKRYTYHILIGLNKIYFNPTVTNWEDKEGEMAL